MRLPVLFIITALSGSAQAPCVATSPHTEFHIAHVSENPKLSVDEYSPLWERAAAQMLGKDCQREIEYPQIRTTIKGFWTDTDLYLLFRCPYANLNLILPANHAAPREGLWDHDVVEMFIGDDWQNIRHYREFEIAPTGDWIDLAIDLNRDSFDRTWRSGWETLAWVDEKHKVWYAAARIPLKAVSTQPVNAGTKWRMNMYRIDGPSPDATRHFLCWQPTCDSKRGNHVPESFGTLVFGR
jgi:hypothetical protein